MTREEKVDFLQQYLDMEPDIICIQNEIDRWYSIAERITPTLKVTGGGDGSDRLQSAVAEIDELQRKLAEKLFGALQARSNVEQIIQDVPERHYRTMLTLRYIEGMTFEKMAGKMGKSEKQMRRWHENIIMSLNVRLSA